MSDGTQLVTTKFPEGERERKRLRDIVFLAKKCSRGGGNANLVHDKIRTPLSSFRLLSFAFRASSGRYYAKSILVSSHS